MFLRDRIGLAASARAAGVALAMVSVTLLASTRSADAGGGRAASRRFLPPAISRSQIAQLSLEQSRGVIFFSAAYLAACSLTIGSRMDRSAL